MIDNDAVMVHLTELQQSIDDCKRYQTITLEELCNDRDTMNMVLHALFMSIQTAIDITNHIISQSSFKRPATYREAFEILADEGLISRDLSIELADLAGFRNVLAHIYWKLNLEEAYSILHNDMQYLIEYERVIKDILKQES